jgi:dihydrolipoamide dehydrogenase
MSQSQRAHFDLCIIGCGPGGFAGAMRAIDAGKHVCIVERDEIGGTGVKWGALASKTMWELAKDFAVAAKTDRGYHSQELAVDYGALRETVLQAVKDKQYQMLSQIETFSPQCWKGSGSITLLRGTGRFISPHRIGVTLESGVQRDIEADYILITTGSKPRNLAGIRVDQRRIINSDGVLQLTQFPRRMMIVGAGVTGCEYATIFSNFRQTHVYLVDHQDRVIPFEDDDVSDFVSRNLAHNGVKIFHSAKLGKVEEKPEHLLATLTFDDGHAQVIEIDTLMLSVGREPCLESLNLEKAGIAPDADGYLACDDNCCVGGHIYAAGDVTHRPALVNMAVMESRYAIKHMFHVKRWPLTVHNMPTVMFFYPAVAAVGLGEKACQKRRIPYRAATYSNALLTRAIAMRATSGFVKIIISDDAQQKILGMRAVGPQVSNTIMSIALLMDQGKGINDVLKSMYPHPTMSEGIQECLRLLLGKSIHKPQAFPHHLRVKTWHPRIGYREAGIPAMADEGPPDSACINPLPPGHEPSEGVPNQSGSKG